jgi:tRNA threonylcarbamoyladenosine modification (KEOPS) complex  Pcc1 subunit
MTRAVIEIKSDETALLRDSLGPEAKRTIPRTSVTIDDKGGILHIEIEAADVNALRAAINSYLGWVSVGMGTAALARKGQIEKR